MNPPAALDTLVEALLASPVHEDPLPSVYAALGRPPLTLRTVRQHTQLLHAHAQQAQAQRKALEQVLTACQELPPIPLPLLPWGF